MRKPAIDRINLILRIPRDLLDRLDAWRETQFAPPTRLTAIIRIIEDFLDRQEKSK